MINPALHIATYAQVRKYSDRTLTVLLIATAGVLVLVALFARSPWFKAVVLAWVLLP